MSKEWTPEQILDFEIGSKLGDMNYEWEMNKDKGPKPPKDKGPKSSDGKGKQVNKKHIVRDGKK